MSTAEPSGLLPREQADRIFQQRIVPMLLAGAEPQDEPVLVVLTAQAGAGKSVLARDIRASFPAGAKPVMVDVDSFRPFYPDYVALHQTHGWRADDLVQEQARAWFDDALGYLAGRRANVIAEQGLRNREVIEGLMSRFASPRAGPYRIELAVLDTPAAISRLGILERYQQGVERFGLGRHVREEQHDARFAHVPVATRWLESDARLNAVAVYERGNAEPVFRNERDPHGNWRNPQRGWEVLEQRRGQPWSVVRSRTLLTLEASLRARMAPEWRHALTDAGIAALPFLDPAASQPRHTAPAVTFGRYQIVSIAHLDTIRTILRDWPSVEIGVLDLDTPPAPGLVVPEHLAEFYRDCDANTAPAKNPMSATERARFWDATVDAAGLRDRVRVRIIARPENDPDRFNRAYPPERYHLVFPTAAGEGFDQVRNARFEEILNRPVHTVDPPLEYHTSELRAAYQAGHDSWRNGFPPGSLEAFTAADGPRRLLGGVPAGKPHADPVHLAMHGFPHAPSPTPDTPRVPRPRTDRSPTHAHEEQGRG